MDFQPSVGAFNILYFGIGPLQQSVLCLDQIHGFRLGVDVGKSVIQRLKEFIFVNRL